MPAQLELTLPQILLSLLLCVVNVPAVPAQNTVTGAFEGTVTNSDTGRAIAGADARRKYLRAHVRRVGALATRRRAAAADVGHSGRPRRRCRRRLGRAVRGQRAEIARE